MAMRGSKRSPLWVLSFYTARVKIGHSAMLAQCPVCPKADTVGRFMSTRPSLTPLADLGRSAGQAPLHGLHAPGIAAGGDDAEVGARLPERLLVNVGLGGRLLDGGHRFGATCERVLQELLRARPAVGLRAPDRGRRHGFT